MAWAWLVDSRGFAGKVKNATQLLEYQIKNSGASRECPNCHHRIDNSDVSIEWPGLPAGVKFDPSDVELLQHLAGKVGFENARSHIYIDEFIPTLEKVEGICYTHPENLPGSKKDGSSVHFFHRTSRAYATGQRKRRKIHGDSSLSTQEQVRWHKTGKTKGVIENGVQKGWKKIMVLYKSSKKGSRPDKSNWVMHQYHLGPNEEENDNEFVVSKIFYQLQPKLIDKRDPDPAIVESAVTINRVGPTTPNTFTPNPPRRRKRSSVDENDEEYFNNSETALLDQIDEDHLLDTSIEVEENTLEATQAINFEGDQGESEWLAGESQAADLDNDMDDFLSCNEILDSHYRNDEFGLPHINDIGDQTYFLGSHSNTSGIFNGELNTSWETKTEVNTDSGVTEPMNPFNSQDLLDMLNNPGW